MVGRAVVAFGPVAVRLGGELVVTDGRGGTVLVVFAGGGMFVEVELVFREGAVFVLVGCTVDGARPGGYYMCDGVRVRWHLVEVFDREPTVAAALRSVMAVAAWRRCSPRSRCCRRC